jgi:hypothetical protein
MLDSWPSVVDGLRHRGLVDAPGSFTAAGRAIRERIEALTDELAVPAYDALTAELVAGLEPIAAAVQGGNGEGARPATPHHPGGDRWARSGGRIGIVPF